MYGRGGRGQTVFKVKATPSASSTSENLSAEAGVEFLVSVRRHSRYLGFSVGVIFLPGLTQKTSQVFVFSKRVG